MTPEPKPIYQFGPFRVDPLERVLFRDGKVVPLTAKVFDILLLLVEEHGHIVEKQQLMKTIWPDTFVEEGNLTQNISVLRKTLDAGDPDHEYIQTVPRRGYRFVGSVRELRDSEIELIVQEHSRAHVIIHEGPDANATDYSAKPAAQTSGVALSRRAMSSRLPGALIAAMVSLAVIGIAGGFFWQHFRSRRAVAAPVFSLDDYSWQKLSADDSSGGMISPDGEFLVYITNNGNRTWSFKQRRLASLETVTIIPKVTSACWGMALTHDSSFLYYILADESRDTGTLYKVSVLGGTPRKILERINGGPTLSPDDSKVAFIRFGFKPGVSALITANAQDGSDERVLEESDSGPELFNPAWSPDGLRILCAKVDKRPDGNYWSLVEVSSEGGPLRQIGYPARQRIWWHRWLPDGNGVVIIATDPVSIKQQLYLISYPDGSLQRMTNDLNSYVGISMSADQNRLVTNHNERQSEVWIASLSSLKEATRLGACCVDRLSWTPEGRIVYDALKEGKKHLWIMDADGSRQLQLSPDEAVDWSPSVSRDGRFIVFLSTRSGRTEIWRADIDGRNALRLTSVGPDLWQLRITPDSRMVYFSHYKTGRWVLERVGIDGGDPEQVTNTATDVWDISPDGKRIAYSFFDEKLRRWQVAVHPLETGDPVLYFEITSYDILLWTPDGKGLIYKDVTDRNTALWLQPLTGNKPQPFIPSTPETNYWADWSRDGKFLAFVRGKEVMNMVMLTRLPGGAVANR